MIPASVGFQCPECVREGQASVRAPRRGSGLQAAGRRWGVVTLSLIAVNVAIDKMKVQLKHYKEKIQDHRGPGLGELPMKSDDESAV